LKGWKRSEKIGKFEESIQCSNILSFKEDNEHIERVMSSLEDQRLALIEIKPSRPSLKLEFIQIEQGGRIRGSFSLYSTEIVPTHSNQYKDSILYPNSNLILIFVFTNLALSVGPLNLSSLSPKDQGFQVTRASSSKKT